MTETDFDPRVIEEQESPIPKRMAWVIPLFGLPVAALFSWLAKHHADSSMAAAPVAFVGTILASLVAYFAAHHSVHEQRRNSSRNERRNLTFDLHRDFSTEEMLRARGLADRLTQQHADKSYDYIYEHSAPGETICLFMLLGFYERLSISIEAHRVDCRLAVELFGSIFVWWWINSFEEQVANNNATKDWAVSSRLKFLHKHFNDNAGADDWQRWEERADKDKVARRTTQ